MNSSMFKSIEISSSNGKILQNLLKDDDTILVRTQLLCWSSRQRRGALEGGLTAGGGSRRGAISSCSSADAPCNELQSDEHSPLSRSARGDAFSTAELVCCSEGSTSARPGRRSIAAVCSSRFSLSASSLILSARHSSPLSTSRPLCSEVAPDASPLPVLKPIAGSCSSPKLSIASSWRPDSLTGASDSEDAAAPSMASGRTGVGDKRDAVEGDEIQLLNGPTTLEPSELTSEAGVMGRSGCVLCCWTTASKTCALAAADAPL